VDFAIAAASLILFVIDGLEGLTALDEKIAAMLRRSKKKVRLVINKADFDDEKVELAEAYRLGLGEPLRVSAEHGRGEGSCARPSWRCSGRSRRIPTAVATRPPRWACASSAGPTSASPPSATACCKSDRLIVSEVPGTTRDAIELPFEFKGRDGKMYPFRLIDTAGIKAATKLASPVEYFSRLRSLDAIKNTDVVFLVLDAIEGVTQQDKAIAGEAIKEHKPIIVVVNKWDLVRRPSSAGRLRALRRASATTGRNTRTRSSRSSISRPGAPDLRLRHERLRGGPHAQRAVKLHRMLDTKLPTAKLNKVIGYLPSAPRRRPSGASASASIMRRRPATGRSASSCSATARKSSPSSTAATSSPGWWRSSIWRAARSTSTSSARTVRSH
jgi:GTP-binding protein